MESDKYYPLHVHCSTGSIGDSILRISDYVERGKKLGLKSLALTDHGSMAAIYELANTCQKAGIKPIFGEEIYICEDSDVKDSEHKAYNHLVLLAKNQEGFENLLKIHNDAQVRGMYYKPRTDTKHIKEIGAKGIIALSACVAGAIPKAILDNDPTRAILKYREYVDTFEEFYLEIQPGSFDEQLAVNDAVVELAQIAGGKIVVTNDIHYLDAEDYRAHDYHVKLCRSQKKFEEDEPLAYPDTCYWFMDAEQLRANFQYTEYVTEDVVNEGIFNANRIQESCNVTLCTDILMPKFPLADNKTEQSELRHICYQRLKAIIEDKPNPAVYVDRLERELSVIEKKGFCGYFLIVADYVNWARENGIPVGPGRGSAAGSLVNYLLDVSMPDPIQFGLMFERFLDEKRAAIPDVDCDVSTGATGRERLFEYTKQKYGYSHCARVSTLTIRHARGAVQSAARVFGLTSQESIALSKLIPQTYYGDDGEKMVDIPIKDALKYVNELKEAQKKQPGLFELAMDLEGLPSTSGLHAAGMIIAPVSLDDKLPCRRPDNEALADVLATQVTLDDAEQQFVKMDYLALGTLNIIKNTENIINWHFDFRNEELFHDENVWALIGSKNTAGVFQISSATYMSRMWRLAPKTIDELAACLALVRGPCISNGMDKVYMEIIEGKREPESIDPIYDEVTAETNGIMLYQEQILKIANKYGMEMSEAYGLMKAAQKKKVDQLKEMRPRFIELALKAGSTDEAANRVYDMIVAAGLYSLRILYAKY